MDLCTVLLLNVLHIDSHCIHVAVICKVATNKKVHFVRIYLLLCCYSHSAVSIFGEFIFFPCPVVLQSRTLQCIKICF